jgi:hypothetical protein
MTGMNMTRNQALGIVFALSAVVAMQGCATTPQDLVGEGKVNVETIPSRYGHISHVSVLASEPGVRVAGEVHGSTHGRGYILGHVDIEVIYPDGTMQEVIAFKYQNRGGKSRATPFSVEVPFVVPEGSTIRIIHHDAFTSESPTGDQ